MSTKYTYSTQWIAQQSIEKNLSIDSTKLGLLLQSKSKWTIPIKLERKVMNPPFRL
jgi:hypothetical protein